MALSKNILFTPLAILIALLVIVVPFYMPGELMNPAQTGKTIFFLWALLVILPVAALAVLTDRNFNQLSFGSIDLTVLIWVVYIILKNTISKTPFTLWYAEFIGVVLFYLVLRTIKKEQFKWLFIALIIAGAAQAVYGNLQLWGYYPSHHYRFKLTGSFFNPGPYAGYLVLAMPVALGFWLFIKKLNAVAYYLAIGATISIILVLPASQSRAAWLAVLVSTSYLFAVKYSVVHKLKMLELSPWKRVTSVLLIVTLLLSGLTGMYYLKKGSADGRALIWKVTLNMITDHPFTGTGMNGFKANYMDYQAEYFRANPDSGEAMVAGDTKYAFNELLQQTAEHGLTGSLLLVLIFVSAFAGNNDKKQKSAARQKEKQLIVISKAVLLSFIVFAMFSYPVQIVPIKISMVVALAYLASNGQNIFSGKPVLNKNLYTIYIARGFVLCAIAVWVFCGGKFLKLQTEALKNWKYAYTLYGLGDYNASVEAYRKTANILQYNGDFLTNYGKALSMANRHYRAIEVLQKAAKVCSNTVVYAALGDSYKATNQNSAAENAYLHAWGMNPSRFYPKYLLAKLYDETGQKEKAVAIANELLRKPIKIESTAIEEIKAEMNEIIEKNSPLLKIREGNNNNKSQYPFQLQFW